MVGTRRRPAVIIGLLSMLASLAVAVPAAADDPPPSPTIVFDGGGFGHGVGLSQFGARAQALNGWTAAEITGFYYVGSEVAAAADLPIPPEEFEQPLWVGLEQHQTVAELSWPDATGTVCIDPDPSNEAKPCFRTVDVRAGEKVRFEWDAENDQCTLVRTKVSGVEVVLSKVAPDCRVSATVDDEAAIWYGIYGYAGDSIELRRVPSAEAFHVVAVIDLETYVAGLDEMPSHWAPAALEAQMLASRSFALNRYLAHEKPELRSPGDAGLKEGDPKFQKDKCWCHVFDTDSSQVYEGVEATTPERIAAAAATEGQVIAYFGPDAASYTYSNVIEALFSSSNAGRTMSNVDAFGSSKQYPYLIPIDDPWSIDPIAENPYATWTLERTPDFIADRLGWDSVRGAWLVGTDPAVVRFEGIDDGAVVVTEKRGDGLRGTANLLSGQVSSISLVGVPTCNGYFATIWGTKNADTLIGTGDHDVILGLGGGDTIEGRGGHDVICGNGGDDSIEGNNGADLIYAGNGDDTVLGGGGLDTISGGGGADVLDGGNGADVLEGDKGADTIVGGAGNDVLRGGKGADLIQGQAGADLLYGNADDDHLDGGDGSTDECRGGGGTDTAAASCETVFTVP